MTKLKLFAVAAVFATFSTANAEQSIEFDSAQLSDVQYREQIHQKIDAAAKAECRSLYRGELFSQILTRNCVADTKARAMADLEASSQQRVAEAGR